MWHQTLSHELKTYLSTTVTELKELARQTNGLENCISYRQAHLYAIEAMDLAENWMDSHRSKESVTPSGSAFSPLAIIKEYLNLNIYRIEQDSIELQQTPSWADERWDSRLDGDAQKFGRVVRVLLDNAFRHGREYLGVASSRVVPVSLEVEVTDGRWLLTITNPGQMDANAYYYRFHPGAVPNKPVPGGSHVGLYAARYLVGLYGGDLSLENMPKNLVQARLSWPLTINTAGR